MPMVCLLPRAAAWHHPDACCRRGSDLPVLSQLELMLCWKPTIRCHWAGCDADVLDHFCEKPGHGVLVHWLLCHTHKCVVHKPCTPVYVPQLFELLHQTIAGQLMLSAVRCVLPVTSALTRRWAVLNNFGFLYYVSVGREAVHEWTEGGSFYQQNFGDKYPCTRRFPTHVRTALLSGVNYRHVNYRCPGVCCPGVPAYFS